MHALVCFRESAWSLPHCLPSLVVSKGGAAIGDPCRTLILHCYCIPTKLQMGLASLFTAYTRCKQVLPWLLRTRVPGGIAYPYGAWDCLCYSRPVLQRDCLPMLAFHVNVYALITPPPWSILSLSQPPLQGVRAWSPWSPWLQPTARSPCVEIDRSLEKAHSCGPRRPAYHLPFCSICPRYGARLVLGVRAPWRPSYHLPFVSFAHLSGARPKRASLSLPLCAICPVLARGPSSERALHRQPSYHLPFVSFAHLYGARPERASF